MSEHGAGNQRALTTAMADGIALLTFDLPGESVNKFNAAVKQEFLQTLDALEQDTSVRAAVLLSGKKDIWIAGADIEEFLQLQSVPAAELLSREGQEMLERVARLRLPLVAAIDGACLGGGLELALACTYRIVSSNPKTVLALPEVQLGLIPGAGGTQRLPRVVGLREALDMILTGKNVRATKALRTGLVHELVHPSILRTIALQRAAELASGKLRPSRNPKSGGLAGLLLDRQAVGRSIVLKKARSATLEKTRGNFPATVAAIDAVAAGYSMNRDAAYRNEARLFGEMAMTPVCRQLIYLFFASTALKKDPGVSEPAPDPLPVRKVGVLGAGFMGAGIAGLLAQNGVVTRMKDADVKRVAGGLAMIRPVMEERLRRRHITRQQLADWLSLVSGTTEYSGFPDAQVVIEAVFEDLAVKQQVLREVEKVTGDDAIFATNTSTIPISSIAAASTRPDRVLGMHFFSPVHRMPLLEVVVTPDTNPQVTATAVALGKRLGKTVVVVNDGPGFFVNRILAPYINEACWMLDGGADIRALDEAIMQFGFPVGPITLIDEVGLDIASKAGAIMVDAFGARLKPAQALQAVVQAGRLGRKNKSGFYTYDSRGKKGEVDMSVYDLIPGGRNRREFGKSEITQRLSLAMVNEAARAMQDGILRSARDGDIAAVFGIGFPPFLGGPFRYLDTLGAGTVVRQLEELETRFPGRFQPADLLLEMAATGERFHP